MEATLKTEIQEIAEVVKSVPVPLQLRAFEILLLDAVDRIGGRKRSRPDAADEGNRDDADGTKAKKKKDKMGTSIGS